MLNQGHVKFHYGGRKFIIFATLAQLQLIFLIFRLAFHQFRKLNYHFNLSNNRFRKLEMPQKRREILAFFEKIIIETLLLISSFLWFGPCVFRFGRFLICKLSGQGRPLGLTLEDQIFILPLKLFCPGSFFLEEFEYTIILRILFLITELKTWIFFVPSSFTRSMLASIVKNVISPWKTRFYIRKICRKCCWGKIKIYNSKNSSSRRFLVEIRNFSTWHLEPSKLDNV